MTRKRQGIVRDHALALDEIIAWARVTDATPLEIGVLEEIRERVALHAKNGALVRIRIKNHNNGETIEQRQRKARRIERDAPHVILPKSHWTADEEKILERAVRDHILIEEVVELLPARSRTAIRNKRDEMGFGGWFRKKNEWSEEDLDILRTMARDGKYADEIAPLVGREKDRVQEKARLMGIRIERRRNIAWGEQGVTPPAPEVRSGILARVQARRDARERTDRMIEEGNDGRDAEGHATAADRGERLRAVLRADREAGEPLSRDVPAAD